MRLRLFKFVLCNIFVSFFIFALFNIFSYAAVPVPTAKEHPRLLINKNDIEVLRRKTQNAMIQPLWKKIVDELRAGNNAQAIFNQYRNSIIDINRVMNTYETNALMYVLKLDYEGKSYKDFGKKAVELATLTLQEISNMEKIKDSGKSVNISRCLRGVAFVYDWCNDILTSEDKIKILNLLEICLQKLELGYPPSQMDSINGIACGPQFMNDLLSIGVAVYDEKPDIYNLIAEWFFSKIVPSRNFMYASHMQYQGDSFGTGRYECEMLSAWIFKKLGIDNVFSENIGMVPYKWIYSKRPDGQFLRDGDTYFSEYDKGKQWSFPMTFILSSSYFNDYILFGELQNHYSEQGGVDLITEFLFYDTDLGIKSLKGLPLTKYFGEPMGTMIARTGWDSGISVNSSSVVAEMKVIEYQTNFHQHLDAGSFQIYFKGPLAIDSGIFSEFGSSHDLNYYKRTIAHNSMLVVDPQEEFKFKGKVLANDGGQYFPNEGAYPSDLEDLKKNYKIGSVEAYAFGPDKNMPEYSYLKGDITKAYSKKVSDYKRSFVFLNLKNDIKPAALIVFDKVTSSNADFKKKWLLHSVNEPKINDNIVSIVKLPEKTKTGMLDYKGMLVNYTLFPEKDNLNIEKIGGDGKEFMYEGINYAEKRKNEFSSEEPGAWRIEVSPKSPSKDDVFLNVLLVADSSKIGANMFLNNSVEKLYYDDFIGVKLSDWVVLFNKESKKVDKEVNFDFSGNKEARFLVTDLERGLWKVEGATDLKEAAVSDEGSIYFEGKPSSYKLTLVEKNVTPTPSPEIEVNGGSDEEGKKDTGKFLLWNMIIAVLIIAVLLGIIAISVFIWVKKKGNMKVKVRKKDD